MGIPEYPLRATCGEHGEYRHTKTQQTFDIQDLDNYIMINHVVAKKVNKQTENSSNSRLVVRLCPNNIRETVSKTKRAQTFRRESTSLRLRRGWFRKL